MILRMILAATMAISFTLSSAAIADSVGREHAPVGSDAFTWAEEVTLAPLHEGAFSPADHLQIARDLVRAGGCSEAVAQEIWRAEATVTGRSDASRHFLNGALAPGIEYVRQQIASIGTALSQQDVESASRSLGRALHAVQSFYANTNYVELQYEKGLLYSQVPLFQSWLPNSDEWMSALRGDGLISGCDPMMTRPSCRQSDYSRAEIEKRPFSDAGKRKLDRWSRSAYQAAVDLAERASIELIRAMVRRFPSLADQCASPHGALLVPVAISAKAFP